MIGTFLHVCFWFMWTLFQTSKYRQHPFETDTKGRHSSSLTFPSTGQLTEMGRPKCMEGNSTATQTSWLQNMVVVVGCLTSQQQASVSQGRICTDNFTCCHTEIEVADQTFYLTQSQYTDTGPTSPGADPITPGAWQGSHWSANF